MRPRFGLVLALVALCAAGPSARAQDAAALDAPTIRVQSRLVVEDVMVMDAHGNPVHGLPPSAFHVTDNGRPQQLRGFEEGSAKRQAAGTEVPAVQAPLPRGTFRSDTGLSTAAVTEVLLIDTDSMELTDQMFLGEQLKQSVAAMPAGVPVALFSVRAGRVIPILSATTDREALMQAFGETVPVQNHAIDSKFQSALNQLMTVAAYLQQTGGRKDLIWFSGDFPLVPEPPIDANEAGPQPDFSERDHEIHLMQEALAEARVSVSPVDVRGVLPATFSFEVKAAASGAHSQMQSLAAATGGRAYMLNNLREAIVQAVDLGRSAYTLTYSPTPYSLDQSFHRVTVTVDGGYAVSYRMGYLATYTGAGNEPPRTRLTRGGAKTVDPDRARPMVFQVHLSPREDGRHVAVEFSIALSELKQEFEQGVWSSKLLVSTYAYDASGRVRSGKVQELDTNLSDDEYGKAQQQQKRVATTQEVDVPKGAKYLLVIARDRESQRTGSLLLQTRLLASLAPGGVGTTTATQRVPGKETP